jgi:hypothetical protein
MKMLMPYMKLVPANMNFNLVFKTIEQQNEKKEITL